MIGMKLAQYEITQHLGSGGMGDVYQATDLKLGRTVAIKFLPEAFIHDPERILRFQREARVLASLNHPNIAGIYGMEESEGQTFLVLELVPGETLAERLNRGAIPVDEAATIALQIAEALQAAQEIGVVHRDLKPANLKITRDGKVKVLDFGLAKMCQSGGTSNSSAPTMTSSPGMIVGTARYMPPEQVKGQEADRTSDVWAFGCVLYEMLGARAVFEGETIGEILATVLNAEPDWQRLPVETPEGLRRLLRRCLNKDRKERLQHFGDARIEILEVLRKTETQIHVAPTISRRSIPRRSAALVAALVIVALMALGAMLLALREGSSSPEMRVDITTPPTTNPTSIAISPDGRKIVFAATIGAGSRLLLRSLDSISARSLAGTDGASLPFWSPDSRSVGFYADGKLKRIDVDGGSIQVLASAALGSGGSWNRDNTIIFAPTAIGRIFQIPAAGGEPTAITRPQGKEEQQRETSPRFLPDDRHFLYYVEGRPETRGTYIGQLDGTEGHRLFDSDSTAVYAASEHLLFVRQGTLFAQAFDPDGLALTGVPFPVVENIAPVGTSTAISTSQTGSIAYRTSSANPRQQQFVWFDRSGKEMGKVGEPDKDGATNPSLSPDGRHLALARRVSGNTDIWLLEIARGVLTRLTFDEAVDGSPNWSPDGMRIVFASTRKGLADLFQRSVTGTGIEPLVLTTTQNKSPTDWSTDGRFVLYRSNDPASNNDIWALNLDSPQKPFPVVQTEFEERDAQFSPDGKWIAYQSNESGRFEVYAQPFPGPGRKKRISTNGGAQVRWRSDGKELFYIAPDERLMAVTIRRGTDGQTIESDAPKPLFATRVGGAVQFGRQQYVVSRDGQRFLMNTVTEEPTLPITLILNWKPKAMAP